MHTLTASEWTDFFASGWDRRVVHWTCPLGGPLVTEEMIFRSLLAARRDGARQDFFLNWQMSPGQYSRQDGRALHEDLLPVSADISLTAFATRISHQLDGLKFCYRLRTPDLHDRALRLAIEDFFSSANSPALCSLRPMTVLLFGDYDATPIGVHADNVPIMQFIVTGQKVAYFWQPDAWKTDSWDPHAYAEHMGTAAEVMLRAGDIVYWPPGHHHVFRSVGFSVALSVYLVPR